MKKFSLDKFYKNSKFDFYKHFWKFVIAPAVLIITAIVLLCTVGFNAGFDFTGGNQITICSNNDLSLKGEGVSSYDLDKGEDYNEFIKKIDEALKENDLSSLSYQKTIVTVEEVGVFSGDALIIRIQNASENEISEFKNSLVKKLGYDKVTNITNADEAILSSKVSPYITQYILNLVITALVSAIAILFVYLSIRLGIASAMSIVFGLAHDVLIMLCFALVFRFKVELTFLAGTIVLMMFSLINNIFLFNNISNNAKNGKFEDNGKYYRSSNKDVANYSVKETLSKQTVFACIALLTISLVAIIATTGVRAAVLPFLLGICSSVYSSIFILPVLWAISYVPSKKKKVKEEKKKDEYVV